MSSSPIAVGVIPKSASDRYPNSAPGAMDGEPGCWPGSETLFFTAVNGFTTVAPLALTTGRLMLVVVFRSAVVSPNELFDAVTVHVLVARNAMVVGSQELASEMLPCRGTNATGRCSVGTPLRCGTSRTSPKYCAVGADERIVMSSVTDCPGFSVNRLG